MKNYISIDNKKIEISEEMAQRLEEQFTKQETPSSEVAMGEYQLIGAIDWNEKEEVLIGVAKVDSVQLGQKVAHEASEGTECGMKINHDELVFEVGDRLELFTGGKK